ncbi:MAG: murein biosynthesis integral membrane protein MurJ, partial [Anaerolineae bacterium]|nr:murein biosynthesis integral membrane protein MurJ [Anaerolineae bacterium]
MNADTSIVTETTATEAPSAVSEQEATNAGVAGATGILALGNISSRIMGLAREKTLAYLFGASAQLDAFRVAVIVPKTFYDLLIGGHVNGAIIPVLSEIVTIKGRDELWKVVNILLSLLMVSVTGLVLAVLAFAPQIVRLAAGGYDDQTLALATSLLRVTTPALIFLSLFAVFSGTLYALKRFTWPAFAGIVFNTSIVAVTLLLAQTQQIHVNPFGMGFDAITIERPESAIMAAALGWLIGALAQMILQLSALNIRNIRITFDWRHPALRRIFLLYLPVMFSLLLDTLVIRFFSYNLASQTGIEGSLTYMDAATTLIQFPQGLVATAISVAILPTLAAQTALSDDKSQAAYRDTLGLGLRLAITLIIPAALGLFVLATPIIMLLFQGGEFTSADTLITVQALRYYLIGLPFAALDLRLVYAFYARKDTFTPALIGLFSHGVYIVTVLLLFERFSLYSLMLADSLKHIVHASISGVLLHRRLRGFGDQRLL